MAQKYKIICKCAKKLVLLHTFLDNMTILSLDTTTSVCSASLVNDKEVIGAFHSFEGHNHAAALPQMVEQLLSLLHEREESLDAVVLSEGPGSYTGLRIGASFAKGLCYGLQIPLIPVSTLDLLVWTAQAAGVTPAYWVPMIDARRMEVYTEVYGVTPPIAQVIDTKKTLEQLCPNTDMPIYYFGDGAAKCQKILAGERFRFIEGVYPNTDVVMPHLADCKKLTDKDIAYYEPFYLKNFQAAPAHVKGLN